MSSINQNLSHWIETASITKNFWDSYKIAQNNLFVMDFMRTRDGVTLFRCCVEMVPLLQCTGDDIDAMGFVGVHPIYLILYELVGSGILKVDPFEELNGPFWSARIFPLRSNSDVSDVKVCDDPTLKSFGVTVRQLDSDSNHVQIEANLLCIIRPLFHSSKVKFIKRIRNVEIVPSLGMMDIAHSFKDVELDLSESLEGRQIWKDSLLVIENWNVKMSDLCFDTIDHLYRYDGVARKADLTDSSEFYLLHINNISTQKGCRLGPKETFTLSLTVKQYESTPLKNENSNRKSIIEMNQMRIPPGYNDTFYELVKLAKVGNKKASASGVLLVGCTGVGKSTMGALVARHLSEVDPNAVSSIVSIQSLLEYHEQRDVIKHITSLFDRCTSISFPILILDNLELICEEKDEDESVENYALIKHAVTKSIDLISLDKRFRNRAPFILGICNEAVTIPNSLVRVGRLEKVVQMSPPTQQQRRIIIQFMLEKTSLKKIDQSDQKQVFSQWTEALLPRTSGFTSQDIRGLFDKTLLLALSRSFQLSISNKSHIPSQVLDATSITWPDIEGGVKDIVPAQLELLDVIPPIMGTDAQWISFAGYNNVKQRLYRTVIHPWDRRNITPDNNTNSLKIPPPTGVIFHGPSGTGKTEAALCLAAALKVCVIQVKASDILDKWLGGSEATIRRIFSRARAASPCAILFDEIDAIAANREDSSGSDVHSRILSTLLNEMDGISKDDKHKEILVIGATNRLDAIDAALLRPGRLQEHVFLPLPSESDCLDILKFYCQKIPLSDSISLDSLSKILCKHRLNGSNIKNICRDACLNAMREASRGNTTTNVTMANFLTAVKIQS